MSASKKIFCIVGTRPELIKTYPVLRALRQRPEIETLLVETTQHQDLLTDLYKLLGLKADLRLDLSQTLANMPVTNDAEHLAKLASQLLASATELFSKHKPDLVIVQGDTLSAAQAALAAWYLNIPVAHIEAGLRSHDISQPYPEELCRRTIDQIASLNFAATPSAMDNLNGVQGRCFLTGNTVVDALNFMRDSVIASAAKQAIPEPYVLITAHRRENQAQVIPELAKALAKLATNNRHYNFVIIKHANPLANKAFFELENSINLDNIRLLDPVPYPDFLDLLAGASFVISDSGGIQEEAPYFGVAVLVLREITERIESLDYGLSKLVGSNASSIYQNTQQLISDPLLLATMREAIRKHPNLYGDGKASERITKHCLDFLLINKHCERQSPLPSR